MTSDPDALVAFVRARLDEDEATARAVGVPDIWRADSSWAAELLNPLPSQRHEHPGYVPMITQADLDHIARHDPARVLREVEAKRELLAWYLRALEFEQRPGSPFQVPFATREVLEKVLRILANAWDSHPDFREEWRLDRP